MRGRHPTAYVGQVCGHTLGERLRELAPRAVIGEELVSTRPLDGRRQGPGTGELHLQHAVEVLGQVLELVEVLAQQGSRAPQVDARPVGEPPAGGLQVEPEVADHRQGPTRHRGAHPASRELGQVRQVGSLTEDEPDGLA